MPEWLTVSVGSQPGLPWQALALRLAAAAFGLVVAWLFRDAAAIQRGLCPRAFTVVVRAGSGYRGRAPRLRGAREARR
jgi:hypothetical protein